MLILMTAQAARIHFLGGRLGRVEDLGNVSRAVHMGLARPMAALAGHPAATMRQRKPGVGIAFELRRYLFMTSRAGFRTHKPRGRSLFPWSVCWLRARRRQPVGA